MLLAVLFGQLTKRVPASDGGLYAYSRHEFGDLAGYLVGWCYWVQAWAGNAAIVASSHSRCSRTASQATWGDVRPCYGNASQAVGRASESRSGRKQRR
jgi:L-asparagine transporter-like permease